jgi:hypothetical protein
MHASCNLCRLMYTHHISTRVMSSAQVDTDIAAKHKQRAMQPKSTDVLVINMQPQPLAGSFSSPCSI